MAFAAKTDYSGLSAITSLANKLVVRDANDNDSNEKYQPQGQDGSFIATEVYGSDSAPSNSFAVKGAISVEDGDIKLNAVTTVDSKKFALESFQISTGAASEPSISATSQEIEADATDAAQCKYAVPAFTLTPKHHAQILFSAFTMTGTGCHLTQCSATVGASINKIKVAGVKVASDINSGIITVTGSILQAGATAPTITPADGWVLTKPPTCTNPETAYKSYSFEVQKTLTKTAPST